MSRTKSEFHPPHTLDEYRAQLVPIPAGAVFLGSSDPDRIRSEHALPLEELMVPEFRIGKTPVTVAIWEEFCAETGYPIPPIMRINGGLLQKDHPIVNVSWEDVQAFLGWAGLMLPTDLEWEKAARGTDRRLYPWGWRFTTKNLHCTKPFLGENGTMAVGSFPAGASPYGVLDLSGNVWEWCADWFTTHYRELPENDWLEKHVTWESGAPLGQTDNYALERLRPLSRLEIIEGEERLIRGGSFRSTHAQYEVTTRHGQHPKTRQNDIGFRCVAR